MAVLQATHPDQVIKDEVSEYYIAQEIDVATDGLFNRDSLRTNGQFLLMLIHQN